MHGRAPQTATATVPSHRRAGSTLLRLALALALLAPLAGCSDEETPDWSDPVRITFSPELKINLASMTRLPSGLYFLDEEIGTGPAVIPSDSVVVGYVGSLPNGRVFDAAPPTAPVGFRLTQVIPGWQEGLLGMRPGGIRLLVIPPGLAYGTRGAGGVIPPNATLVFRVELVALPLRTS